MEKYTVITMLSAGIIFFAALAVFLLRTNKEHLSEAEMLLRNKGFGTVLAAAALVWVVPQVQAVAWAWLANYAWIIAAAALLLSIKYLDNPGSNRVWRLSQSPRLPRPMRGVLRRYSY